MPWRTIAGDTVAPKGSLEMEVLTRGIFEKRRFLDLLRYFIVFEKAKSGLVKKVAGYHQFHAVNKAVECTLDAASAKGDRRVGVVWHTQGSGKSLTMAFYAGKIIQHPQMSNPTLVVPHERAIAIRDDVGFFQTVRAGLAKTVSSGGRDEEELNVAVRQIVSRAVASDKVIDIFSAAGLKAPEISILSDQFLAEVKGLPQRNLAFEALKKLLNDEIKVRAKKNLVQSRLFSQMLEESIRKYQNRAVETAQILQELIDLAKQMREADKRGENLGFTTEELAFYDALEVSDSAVKILGDDTLKTIARELVDTVHKNTSIDWTQKESVKAKLRSMVKRILRKYSYPPDKQEKATQTVLEQAELLCHDIAA